MDFSTPQILFLFAVVWIATFPLAWKTLAVLVSKSLKAGSTKSLSFWILFFGYRFIIFAPYGVLLLFGEEFPGLVKSFIWGWVVLGFGLSLVRFAGSDRVLNLLWYIYGFVYDGLNRFYPYRHLLSLVFDRLNVKSGQRVLDLGSGTGNLTKMILEVNDVDVVAVDNSRSMLGAFKRKFKQEIKSGRVAVSRQDIISFLKEQPDNTFDRIAMVNVVYAVPDREVLWREVGRILKKDGVVVATTSDRAGSKAIIREHLDNDSFFRLLTPRLLMVAIIDNFISELSKSNLFNFPPRDTLVGEAKAAGEIKGDIVRCYGGPKDGVNILFEVRATR